MKWFGLVLWITKVLLIHSTDEIIVAVDIRYGISFTDKKLDVSIQINGTEGNISKTKLDFSEFETDSTKYQTFKGNIGEPFMVTVYATDGNWWVLQNLNIIIGSKEYVFTYNVLMKQYTWGQSEKPRSAVSIMKSCQQSERKIRCAENYVINIIDAEYGRSDKYTCLSSYISTCQNVDVRDIVQKHCNRMSECDLKSVQDTNINGICASYYIMVVFECNILTKVLVKTGGNNYSGTENEVSITIKGMRGDIFIASQSIHFLPHSTRKCSFNQDIGEPYMITVNKSGDDALELQQVTLIVGKKSYVFLCNYWMNEYAREHLPEPRPAVNTMKSCQHCNTTIHCTGNDVINIINATFGQWDDFTCHPLDTFTCENKDVLEIVQSHCNGVSQCHLKSFQNKYIDMKCTNSYTMVVFQCIPRVLWTINVKTSDKYTKSASRIHRVIQLRDEKSRNHRIQLEKDFAAGSLECFEFNSSITVPSELIVNGDPSDTWELEFISFSNDNRYIVFICNYTANQLRETVVLYPGNEKNLQNPFDLQYCTERTLATLAEVSTTKAESPETRILSSALASTTDADTPDTTPNSSTAKSPRTITILTEDTTSTSVVTKGNTSYDTNESLCCSNVSNGHCFCGTHYYGDTGCSIDEVECVVTALREQLIVDVKSTSSFKRKKISAYDDRVSSQMIGAMGVVILVASLLIIVIPDCVYLLKYCCTNLNQKFEIRKNQIL